MNYVLSENAKNALIKTVADVAELARPKSGGHPGAAPPSRGQEPELLGFATITGAGADGHHWQWKFALEKAAADDGTMVAGDLGSDDTLGECVIAGGGAGAAGLFGLLYTQLRDDSSVALVFAPLPDQMVVVKILSAEFGGGKYAGQAYGGNSTADPLYDLSMPEGMSPGADCLVLNLDEDGTDTHVLKLPCYGLGFAAGRTDPESDPPGRPIIILESTIGERIDGLVPIDPSSDSPDDATWSRLVITSGSAYGGVPVTLTQSTRLGMVDNEDGGSDLTLYTRAATYDAAGRLLTLSAESSTILKSFTDLDVQQNSSSVVKPASILNFKGLSVTAGGTGEAIVSGNYEGLLDVDITDLVDSSLACTFPTTTIPWRDNALGKYGLMRMNEIDIPLLRWSASGGSAGTGAFEHNTFHIAGFFNATADGWTLAEDTQICSSGGGGGTSAMDDGAVGSGGSFSFDDGAV